MASRILRISKAQPEPELAAQQPQLEHGTHFYCKKYKANFLCYHAFFLTYWTLKYAW